MNLFEAEMAPGYTGLLIDEVPTLTTAMVRPFAWAILLARGAVHPWEVVNAVSAICSSEDLKVANWDDADDDETRTWAEACTDEVLGEMLISGLCRYNEQEYLWVLDVGENRKNVPTVIAAVSMFNAQIPKHFLLNMEVK